MPDALVDFRFPLCGIDLTAPFWRQPPRPVQTGAWEAPLAVAGDPDPGVPIDTSGVEPRQVRGQAWARTCAAATNVRGFEGLSQRGRGGSRPGLAKYVPQPPVAGWLVQDVNTLIGEGYPPPGGTVTQQSLSGRVVSLVAVSQGNVFVASPGSAAWAAAVNATGNNPPLNFTGIIFSAANNQKLWFADGVNYRFYDPSANTVNTWVASAGTLPADDQGNTPRLIATWRGRTVLAGVLNAPQQWFMSAQGDPTDWDFFPPNITPTQAVGGNSSPAGLVGEPITALIPFTDDVMLMGCESSIHAFNGDPMAGGRIDLVTRAVGVAWGQAWCQDPYGTVYFVSNRNGVYSMVPGQPPQRLSQPVEKLLVDADTGANLFRMLWDDRFQGFHLFVTPLARAQATTHFFYEQRTGAWWQDQFANPDHNPLACCVMEGNLPGDRVPVLGSWDGYVRSLSPTAADDDGTPIQSSVTIGPLVTKDMDDILLKDVQGVLGQTSGAVNYAVLAGATAEAALASTPVATGTWAPGRNLTLPVRRAGHALYVVVSSANAWALEQIRCRVQAEGKVRRRGA